MMKTIRYIRENFKLLLMTALAIVIVAVNGAFLVDPSAHDHAILGAARTPVDFSSFYDNEFMPLTFTSQSGNIVKLPDKRNHIILGLNRQFERDIQLVAPFVKNIDFNDYDADIMIVSLNVELVENTGIPVYT